MANQLNGWRFRLDGLGYWCLGGGEQFGPFDTSEDMRHFATKNRCPHTENDHNRRAERSRSKFLLADN